jgi:hypothetical protein
MSKTFTFLYHGMFKYSFMPPEAEDSKAFSAAVTINSHLGNFACTGPPDVLLRGFKSI